MRPAATLAHTAPVLGVLRVSKKHLARKKTLPHLPHYGSKDLGPRTTATGLEEGRDAENQEGNHASLQIRAPAEGPLPQQSWRGSRED